MTPVVALVVPCFNEEAVIGGTVTALHNLLSDLMSRGIIHSESFVLFVDDGSRDHTVEAIVTARPARSCVRVMKLAANAGHQAALLAGLHYVTDRADCCISLDADLQDDIGAVEPMIARYRNGSDIVYGIRSDRTTDSWFKRSTAQIFYWLMNLFGVPVLYNHADYRLVSRRVLYELKKYREVNLFLRGIFPRMGFPFSTVGYKRNARQAGESKYPFWKMLRFAVMGITSFTNAPLKVITVLGTGIFTGSLVAGGWVLWVVALGKNVPGWASITLPIYLLGGIQLLAVGILGEYISKIYMETKARPHYHIDQIIESDSSAQPERLLAVQTNPFLQK